MAPGDFSGSYFLGARAAPELPENIANNTTTAAFKEGFSHECSSKPSHTSNKNILCFHLIVNKKL
jgi:hypothetical protein